MFRFIHTADWQIGMRAAHAGRAAEAVREARLQAAANVVEAANARGVDALILAGDTFEDSNVPRDLVRRVVDILRRSRAPVFVLPGNHDPLVPKGVFDHLAWGDAHPGVTVLRDATPVAVGEADLLPCPLTRARSIDDPLAALDGAGTPGRIRVAVAHGSLLGASAPDEDLAEDHPMDRAHAGRAGVDYVALGHWHSRSFHDLGGVPRIVYCGTHEPTKAGEPGGCLLVEIAARGAVPRTEEIPCAVMEWRRCVVTLSAPGDLQRLRAQIEAEPAESVSRVLFDLKIDGAVPLSDHEQLADLESLLASRFLHARLRCDGLRFMPSGHAWIDGLPAGAPREAARRLAAQAAGAGRESQVAARALQILFQASGA